MADPITEKVLATLAAVKRIPREQVTLDSSFEALGLDSLDTLNILFDLENEFQISIPDEDARSIRSVRDIVDGVKKLMAAIPTGSSADSGAAGS